MSRKKIKKNLDTRLPYKEATRYILHIDESGVANFNDVRKEFVLTGVIIQVSDAQNYRWYYETIKKKFTNKTDSIHATTLFNIAYHKTLLDKKSKIFRIPQYKRQFIDEIKMLLDTIPFVHLSVCINKNKLKEQIKYGPIKYLHKTNLGAMEELYLKYNTHKTKSDFNNSTISENLLILKKENVPLENNFYPYKLALENVIRSFIAFLEDYSSSGEIVLENSPTEIIAWETIRKIQNQTDKESGKLTSYANTFRDKIVSISFSAKKARYLGLELADLIAFGYGLKMRRKLKFNTEYAPIWKIIKKREEIARNELKFDCNIEFV